MRNLLERVQASIDRRGLLSRGQSVLVAVSGGVDSMVLLQLLHKLSRKNSWRLTVAHLNHRLRGRSSAADERLVIRTAGKLGLPVAVESAEVRQLAREQKLSLEMAARKVRHDFLACTAARLKIRTIALAHHADDQLELFFLRLLRGSGSEGLAGMKWLASSPAEVGSSAFRRSGKKRLKAELPTLLIRPLLDVTKAELLAVAQENKISFREDASNASLDIQRNRIRHELLPLLRDYQPAIDRTLTRVMEIVGTEAELVGQLAADWLGSKARRQSFNQLPVAVQRRYLQLQLRNRKIPADFELVEHLRTRPGHFIKVSPHLAVNLEAGGSLGWQESQPVAATNPAICQIALNGRCNQTVFSQVRFDWQVAPRTRRTLPKPRAGIEHFDADKVGMQIVLRHWQPGDRFQPSGLKSAVKLQNLFVNAKIPRGERLALVLATTADGEIFWVERLRIAERFKLGDATNRGLQWHWKRL